jgi:hypothetical protein
MFRWAIFLVLRVPENRIERIGVVRFPRIRNEQEPFFSVLVLLVSWFPILKFYDEMPLSPIQGVEGPSFLS